MISTDNLITDADLLRVYGTPPQSELIATSDRRLEFLLGLRAVANYAVAIYAGSLAPNAHDVVDAIDRLRNTIRAAIAPHDDPIEATAAQMDPAQADLPWTRTDSCQKA